MGASMDEERARCDPRALAIARTVRGAARAEVAFLFGSRARGDHRDDSDVGILLISDERPLEDALRELEGIASRSQTLAIQEAAGVKLGWKTPAEFMEKRTRLNSMAREIAKDSVPVMLENSADRRVRYVFDQGEGEGHIDWQDVQNRSDAAPESAKGLQLQAYANALVKTSDRNFGYIANRVLESGYKAVLASHRIEYPVSGRDGHDLARLVESIKKGSVLRCRGKTTPI